MAEKDNDKKGKARPTGGVSSDKKTTKNTRPTRDVKKEKKPQKEKSINEMGGKDNTPKSRGENVHNDKEPKDRRKKRRAEDKKRVEDREQEAREKEVKEKKIQGLRDRRSSVQKYLGIANTSETPLGEIDWADKNLKAKDRRKLREVLQGRGFSDKDIYEDEKKGINERINKNKKDSLKTGAGLAGDMAGLAGTGGASAILAVPGLIVKALKLRKNKEENNDLKKRLKWRRLLLILPTLLITLGLMLAGALVVATGSQFVGTMLSHPEAIKELNEAGVLGDAMYLGNVTEDVVVDGKVIVKGNPNAQPGCFVYNGVWYCGGCLSTGSTEASSNVTAPEGSGDTTGNLREPMDAPYNLTSNYGGRWGSTHKGIDLVGQGTDLSVYASDGGVVTIAHAVCAPGSGFYPNNDPTCGGWGNYVEIKHEGQPYAKTLYAHLDKVDVKVGDKVDKGQKLGIMGHTGNSTGAHLHFEVWEKDEYGSQVDPRNYIPTFPAKGQSKTK